MFKSGLSRARAHMGMAGWPPIAFRKYRPSQCPKCKYASEAKIRGIPRYCLQAEHKPFLIDEPVKRPCKFYREVEAEKEDEPLWPSDYDEMEAERR